MSRNHECGWNITKLFKRAVLKPWLHAMVHEQNIEMILLLSLLNQWLSPYLSDSSIFGINSYRSLSPTPRSVHIVVACKRKFRLEMLVTVAKSTGAGTGSASGSDIVPFVLLTRQRRMYLLS